MTTAIVAVVMVEAAVRVVDGYGLTSIRLVSRTAAARASVSDAGKWLDPNQAASYVATLPAAPGVDRAWFTLMPEPRSAGPVDPDLDARYRTYPGFELASVYDWNLAFARNVVCEGDGSSHPYLAERLRHLDDLFVFDSQDGRPYPTYRFLRNARYPSGLVTDAFGWRGPDIPLNKPAGRVRIAFVGASTTAGAHADALSYPEYLGPWLERWAQSRGWPVTFDIVNAGREGVLSTSIAAIVRSELAPVRPDLVVYYEGTNQFWPNGFTGRPLVAVLRRLDPGPLVEQYSAMAVRVRGLVDRGRSGREPLKPPVPVNWPGDLSETDPPLEDPRLPVQLPIILRDLDDIRASLAATGGSLVLSSFMWLVYPDLVLDRDRDVLVFRELNERYFPFSYAHMRRFIDFENRAFAKYARVHSLGFNDEASVYPHDPRLFVDSVHFTPAGVKLQAWIAFQSLVPVLERELAAKRLPSVDPGGRTAHPAFTGPPRRLMKLEEIRRACR